jgi:para-aminobenzoate synthetase/4-amino-4-deoxychorismate lyase
LAPGEQNTAVMARDRGPDKSLGLFETLLVLGGAPVELGEHLDRLDAGLGAVFGAGLPVDAAARVTEAAAGLELGRLRLTAAPTQATGPKGDTAESDSRLKLTAEAEPIDPAIHMPAWDNGARLRGFELPGGLGQHKWRDRSALPAEGQMLPLILDRGEALEATRANVFAVRDGALFTPPLDGRVLPGTTRAAVLEIAAEVELEVSETALCGEELLEADEVFLTGSVRGVEPARELDGAELGRGEVAPLLASRLAQRWRQTRTGRQMAAGSDALSYLVVPNS